MSETVTIELPKRVVEFMRDLAKEIDTQDCRGTASPYYFVVLSKREIAQPAGHGDPMYYARDWAESATAEEFRRQINESRGFDGREPITDEEFETFLRDKCEEYSQGWEDVEENVFLTKRGYDQHMELNGHNYRHLKNVQSFVKYAGRNPEMLSLIEAIMAFKEEGSE